MICCLCTKATENCTSITNTTGISKSTFSSVLRKMWEDEKNMTVQFDFSNGFMCSICKYLIQTLDRLQNEVVEVNNLIATLLNSESLEIDKGEGTKKALSIETQNKQKITESETNSLIEKKKKPPQKDKNNSADNKITRKRTTKDGSKGAPTRVNKADSIGTEDKVFYVEALLEKRGYKYLVKWENYPAIWNSWEPRFALPQHIVQVKEFLLF